MDHHCPFIGNCVGFNNQRFFIQFLLYASLTCLNLGISCVQNVTNSEIFIQILSIIGCFAGLIGFLAVGVFGGFQFYLVFVNRTTLETFLASKHNVYDRQSAKGNLLQVFGSRTLGYFFPIKTECSVDGISYPIRIRNKAGEVLFFDKFFVH